MINSVPQSLKGLKKLVDLPPLRLAKDQTSNQSTDKKSSRREAILFGGRLRDMNEQGNSNRYKQSFHKSTSDPSIISDRGNNVPL